MLAERDKLRAKHESGHVMEELTARTKEVEQLKDQLDSYDKEWQARLSAETSKWQARLAEHQQDVESERDRMAEAIAGMLLGMRGQTGFILWAGIIRYHCSKFQYVVRNCCL